MQYSDEEILKMKKEMLEDEKRKESKKNLEQELEESIYDDSVHIIGEEVSFERCDIPELEISIYMPKDFFRLSDDITKQLYPMGNTPTHVFGGMNTNFQLIFNQTSHQVKDSEMRSFVEMSTKVLDIMGPKVRIIEKGVDEKKLNEENTIHIGYVSFVSRAIDANVYNMQFYVSVEGKILMGSMAFPSRYKKRLIPLAKEVINSIELLEESEV